MNQRVVMLRIEVQRLPVALGGHRLVSAGVLNQAHEMVHLRRRTVLAQMLFIAGGRFAEPSLVGQPEAGVECAPRLRPARGSAAAPSGSAPDAGARSLMVWPL